MNLIFQNKITLIFISEIIYKANDSQKKDYSNK